MAFDTVTFWIFFAVAWIVWRSLPFPLAKGVTLLLSLGFYAWWRVEYLPLILASAVIDYQVGKRIHATQDDRVRNRWLAVSLASNLGLLGVFKYAPFLAENLSAVLGPLGVDPERLRLTGWVVPVGISFYTFQTLSYSLDIHRRRLTPCSSFRDFFLFVAFYPQLVAGPIVRASELLPQLARRRRLLLPAVQIGAYYCVVGLFLKVVVADNLGQTVRRVYVLEGLADCTPADAWLATLYFGGQIFADFAGYSAIAIGLAYLMGLRFPRNFESPYVAQSLSEFWTRWHITLSQWLRDYLYIPLGGNRLGELRTYANLMITMLLGGLWHGASWTFVVWGGIHGTALACERRLGLGRRPSGAARPGPRQLLVRVVRIAIVFLVVHIAWVFFRAPSFVVAWRILERMFVAPFREPFGWGATGEWRYLLFLAPIACFHVAQLGHEWFGVRKTATRRAAVAAICLFLLLIVVRGRQDFIYFQF